jgi:hypothetical protein
MAIDTERVRRILRKGDHIAAFAALESEPPLEAAQTYHSIAKDLYWQDRDLPNAKATLLRGIAFALAKEHQEDPEVRTTGKAMCYDLASFCWPGWDEPDIEIGREELTLGQAAAARNLELAIELGRGDGPLANAHFLIGAFDLAWSRLPEAAESFEKYRHHAALADDEVGVLAAEGYAALTRHLEGKPEAEEEFLVIVNRLLEDDLEHGAFFAEQLETARRVFG